MSELNIFSSLKYSAFRIYLMGAMAQMAAMNMQWITIPLLVYRITGSAKAIGIAAVAGTVPHIISSLYGGVICQKKIKVFIQF